MEPDHDRPYVAAARYDGVLVNQHLGQADEFFLFRALPDGNFEEVEVRPAPDRSGGGERWTQLAQALHDCRAVLCVRADDDHRNDQFQYAESVSHVVL